MDLSDFCLGDRKNEFSRHLDGASVFEDFHIQQFSGATGKCEVDVIVDLLLVRGASAIALPTGNVSPSLVTGI